MRETQPDVVLLDLSMPVMDGIEALPTIRRLCPTARIIVLSGFGAQQMSDRAVAAGADGYVQKGAPLTTILEYVREVCAGSRSAGRSLSVVAPSPTPTAGAARPSRGRRGRLAPAGAQPGAVRHHRGDRRADVPGRARQQRR